MDWQSKVLMTGVRRYFSKTMKLQQGAFDYPTPVPSLKIPLYIHIPFCESLCPFCSFHRIKLDRPLAQQYFHALMLEVDRLKQLGFQFNQLYIGGGTPTTMPKELVQLLEKINRLWQIDDIAIETNPNHLNDDILQPLKAVGVTRLSVGVQSLHNKTLKAIGRYDAYGSRETIVERLAETQGKFETFNVDMIFNLPGQTDQEICEDIMALKGLEVDQVSYYPLMPALDNGHQLLKDFADVNFKREQALYDSIVEQMSPEYQLSSAWCFNRKSQLADEYIIDNDQYLGIGSGAFSLIGPDIYSTTFEISQYIRSLEQQESPWSARQHLSDWQLKHYALMTRLFGLSTAANEDLNSIGLSTMRLLGAVRKSGKRYQLTKKGRYWWLIMMREFFMGVNSYRRQLRDSSNATDVIARSK